MEGHTVGTRVRLLVAFLVIAAAFGASIVLT